MKKILQLSLLIIISSCSTINYYRVPNLKGWSQNTRNQGEEFIDSLTRSGVDTIVAYFNGCTSCIRGVDEDYYVFWQDKGNSFAQIFPSCGKSKSMRTPTINFTYFYSKIKFIKNEDLLIPPQHISSGRNLYLYINIAGNKIDFWKREYELDYNPDSIHTILIDKIRSYLYDFKW